MTTSTLEELDRIAAEVIATIRPPETLMTHDRHTLLALARAWLERRERDANLVVMAKKIVGSLGVQMPYACLRLAADYLRSVGIDPNDLSPPTDAPASEPAATPTPTTVQDEMSFREWCDDLIERGCISPKNGVRLRDRIEADAARIADLERDKERLRDALKPFAAMDRRGVVFNDIVCDRGTGMARTIIGSPDFRKAALALEETK